MMKTLFGWSIKADTVSCYIEVMTQARTKKRSMNIKPIQLRAPAATPSTRESQSQCFSKITNSNVQKASSRWHTALIVSI